MSLKDSYHISFLLLFLICGCNISDSERCGDSDKFYYNKDSKKCLLNETTDDGGTPDSGDDDLPTGMGEPCKEDSECEAFEANGCAVNDLRPDDGYCTIKNCTPGECPHTYQCCDCSIANMGVACSRDADAELAQQYLGCTCG